MSEKLDNQWHERFTATKSFIETNQRYPSSEANDPKVKQLGKWIRVQRDVYKGIKRGKLTEERIKLIESLPDWKWDHFRDTWNTNFEQIKQFIADNNRYPSESSNDFEESRIARWIKRQRNLQSKKTGLMSTKRIELLESLPDWSWHYDYEAEWLKSFFELKNFILKNGYYPARASYTAKYADPNIKRLANWISVQRMAYKENKVSRERMRLLEALPKWRWDYFEDLWLENYISLRKFVTTFNRYPSLSNPAEAKLYRWVSMQKETKRGRGTSRLNAHRIKHLEDLPGWSWGNEVDA